METLAQLDCEMLANWHTPIINDFYVMMSMGRLRRQVARGGGANTPSLINDLMCGEDGLESTEPTRLLMRLAQRARGHAGLQALLRRDDGRVALEEIRERYGWFAAHIDDYIERYGDRVMGELKLETITLREDPTFVLKVLRNYVDSREVDADELYRMERSKRIRAEHILRAKLPLWRRRQLRRAIGNARQAVKDRENMRLARTRMFGLYRDVFRALGERLCEAQKLCHPRDVFYLTTDELWAYHEGRSVSAQLDALVDARKREFSTYEGEDPPHHFETLGPVYHGNRYVGPDRDPIDANSRTLQGVGCNAGVVESPLRIIMSPNDELTVDGHILTTLRTDPGWAPLFPTCRGILVERGSTLSHSAVVARELGIPAVVGVPNLLKIVRDGETVRLDGGSGRVERLQQTTDGNADANTAR